MPKRTEPSQIDPEIQRKVNLEVAARVAERPIPGSCPVRLSFSGLRFCGRTLKDGSPACYWHLKSTDKYSAESIRKHFGSDMSLGQALEAELASGRSLEQAYLNSCSLGGDFLRKGPILKGINLIASDLQNASLSYTDFSSANFSGADLSNAKLSDCVLAHANFYGARLFETKFRGSDLRSVQHLYRENFRGIGQFGLPVDRMLERYPEQAAPMYRELVSYFAGRGLFDDASWAAYRASAMRHRVLKAECDLLKIRMSRVFSKNEVGLNFFQPVRSSVRIEYLLALSRWLKSGFFLLITGYGEKPFRVICVALVAILVYALLYTIPGAFSGHGFLESLYFSMITFTTLGYGDVVPRGAFRLVAGTEALAGILFTGLFLFCLGRKTISRA